MSGKPTMHPAVILAALLGLTGCASAGSIANPAASPDAAAPQIVAPAACPDGTRRGVVAQLIFGRNIGHRLGVGEADWTRFLDQEVAPRFPDGLTVLNGLGQWRDPDTGRIVREPSKVLLVALPEGIEGRTRLKEIAEAYKEQFKQQAVANFLETACVSF